MVSSKKVTKRDLAITRDVIVNRISLPKAAIKHNLGRTRCFQITVATVEIIANEYYHKSCATLRGLRKYIDEIDAELKKHE